MSLKSVEGLQARIQKELAWRKKELSALRSDVKRARGEKSYLFRAGLVLTCAHWEGFLRAVVGHYSSHVFLQDLRLGDLRPAFIAQAVFSDVKRASVADFPGSEENHIRLAKRIQLASVEVPKSSEWKPSTESNPGSGVLVKLLSSIGLDKQLNLDEAKWSSLKAFIDEQVVADRHRIAHGEGYPITKAELLERSEKVLALLDVLSRLVIEAAENQSYREITRT